MIHCLALAATLATQAPDLESSLNEALGLAGLTTETARFDESLLRFFRRGEFTTPLYSALSENPWRAPWIMDTKRRELAAMAGQPHLALGAFGPWMDWSVRRTLIGNPIADLEEKAKQPTALANELKALGSEGPVPDSVPQPVREAAALLLAAASRSDEFLRAGLGNARESLATSGWFSSPTRIAASLGALESVDVNMIAAGAHDLFQASARAAAILQAVPADVKFEVRVETRLGPVILTGGSNDRHEPAFLIVDTGGDDTYVSGGPSTAIVIDTHGNDKHLSDPALETTPVAQFANRKPRDHRPGPAGALMGYAVLWDSKGNDLYRSHKPGLGSGRLGFALLHDASGDDAYDAYADSQGFGMFGGGILEDLAGNDRYEGFNQVQGCGQTGGFGYLVDFDGADQYVGNNTVLDFASPQSAQHNAMMGQGAGNGRRADYLEGTSLAGGVGVLFDRKGNDRYSGAVFCQGVGYWEGVGALWDTEGDDRYDGAWYAMGASAHFAIGYLEDEAGNDQYVATMNMAQGAGHDFSVGVLHDRAGNDTYKAPNLSLGGGNANGIGWLLELAGNDVYEANGITFGSAAEATAGSIRERALCLGVFQDLAGEDRYTTSTSPVGDGTRAARWKARRDRLPESQVGVFLDRGR